ncbi:MAG: DUF4124 domain-containing protein [Proteobacteria bacterium]|nr:DUF4124 domain-containing protein [Pseudomonadota bacterium]
MQKLTLTFALALLIPLVASAEETRVYRWVDDAGQVHYGDSIPAMYSELPKQILNQRGITIGLLAGKKSEEQIEADRIEEKRRVVVALQQRADQALLATYLTVEEILMHRDRRVELFQAQSRVTELYLSNLTRRLENLRGEASNFLPYSENPDAPMIALDLADDLRVTKETIARHERNLRRFQADEQQIVARFDGDISRFKLLKGIE